MKRSKYSEISDGGIAVSDSPRRIGAAAPNEAPLPGTVGVQPTSLRLQALESSVQKGTGSQARLEETASQIATSLNTAIT